MFAKAWTSIVVLLAVSLEVHAHAAIAPVLGKGSAAPVRNDVTRPSKAAPCGAGVNVASALGQSTPIQAAADGTVTATITNFNGGKDGSRQVTAQVDAAATGKTFVAMTVTQNGDAAPASAGSQQLVASLPAGTKCTGGTTGNLCLVSFTTLGGFGNCVAVQQGAGAAAGAAANSTATATGGSASNSTATGATGAGAAGAAAAAAGAAGATGAGTTTKGGHHKAHGGAVAAGAAAQKAKGKGHANGGAAAAGNANANGAAGATGAAGAAGTTGAAGAGAAGTTGATGAAGATGAGAATGAGVATQKGNGKANGGAGAAGAVQNGKAAGLNGAIAQANERGRFAQGGSRAARALIAGVEERGEEVVRNVRRSIVGWIWA